MFYQTDMKVAKEKFGSWAAIGGNVSASLFVTAAPLQMDAHCKELIETCAPGGGYFLAPGCVPDAVNRETLHAYLNSTKIYGVY